MPHKAQEKGQLVFSLPQIKMTKMPWGVNSLTRSRSKHAKALKSLGIRSKTGTDQPLFFPARDDVTMWPWMPLMPVETCEVGFERSVLDSGLDHS